MDTTTNTWFCGDEITLRVEMKDPDTGEVIDLDSLTEIVMEVYIRGTKKRLSIFSKTTREGYTSITISDPSTGIFEAVVSGDDTATADEGVYDVEVKYWSGTKPETQLGCLGWIVKSKLAKIELPS